MLAPACRQSVSPIVDKLGVALEGTAGSDAEQIAAVAAAAAAASAQAATGPPLLRPSPSDDANTPAAVFTSGLAQSSRLHHPASNIYKSAAYYVLQDGSNPGKVHKHDHLINPATTTLEQGTISVAGKGASFVKGIAELKGVEEAKARVPQMQLQL